MNIKNSINEKFSPLPLKLLKIIIILFLIISMTIPTIILIKRINFKIS